MMAFYQSFLSNGKIHNPTIILARRNWWRITNSSNGLGWDPIFEEGTNPKEVHPLMVAKLDEVIEKIQAIQKEVVHKSAHSYNATLAIM